MAANTDIEALIALMAKLPGLGPRSARRAVLHLIKKRALLLSPLADAMFAVAASARECLVCGNIGTADRCEVCADPKRANGMICVVEDVSDLWALQRANVLNASYHVLGGTLSPLDGVGPDDLSIDKLVQKAEASIHIAGGDVFAHAESEDMYAAIDALTDKLDRQLIKYKQKHRGH